MTSSRTQPGIAPTISQPPGLPADEWAKETEGAIDQYSSSSKVMDVDRSNSATPGYELPGAFPMESTPEASPTSPDFAKQSVEGVYMKAQNGVGGVYSTAEQAARQYLPTSVVDKLEGVGVLRENLEYQEKPSLSTQEYGSKFTPTHGDVGSLPGWKDEAGVAILPEKRKNEENKIKDATIVQETGSYQSTYKPSLRSSTPSTTPHTTTETPEPTSYPTDSSHLSQDPHSFANVGSNANPFSQISVSDSAKINPVESAHSSGKVSTQPNPPRTGTLTSPDRNVQAAARASRDRTDTGDEILAGSGPVNTLSTPGEGGMNARNNKGTDTTGEGSPAPVNMSHTEEDQTVKNGDISRINRSNGGGGNEDIVIGNIKKGHTRKSSFVQKLKGEAKAFAEKVKTKTRG